MWWLRYLMGVESSDWPSSSDRMSSSPPLVLSTRKVSVPTMETTIRDMKTFLLLSSAGGGVVGWGLETGTRRHSDDDSRSNSTWYLHPSVPLKIDVKIPKKHAGNEINGSLSGGKVASETDNGLIRRRLVTAAWKKRPESSRRLFVENTEEHEGVTEITAVVY